MKLKMKESRRDKIKQDGKTAMQITVPTQFAQKFRLLAHYLSIGGRDIVCSGPDLTIVFDSPASNCQNLNIQNKEQSNA